MNIDHMQNKKKYDNLILQIIKLYQKAGDTKFPHSKVSRGRSYSISPMTEDLFAKFLADNIKCDEIFIDQPITNIIKNKNKVSYPDSLIIRKGVIIGTCDLKMDMGGKRDRLFELCKKGDSLVRQMKGEECKMGKPTNKAYKVSKHFFHNIIIVSNKNANNVLKTHIKKALKFRPNVNVFCLTGGTHLNEKNIKPVELMKKIIIDYDEFDKMLETFK